MTEKTVVAEEKGAEYTPMGESESMKLTPSYVIKHLAHKTKRGVEPSHTDVIKFIQLCKSQRLNPWVGDAYLIGYDSQDGPTFTLITAVQALLKRSEANPHFEGIESGVVVTDKDGEMVDRVGSIIAKDDKVIGGWAYVYRSDRKMKFTGRVAFETYNTGRSRWKKDPAGMIEKVARAAALRLAFPSDLGALYIQEEFSQIIEGKVVGREKKSAAIESSASDSANEALARMSGKAIEHSEPAEKFIPDQKEEAEPETVEASKKEPEEPPKEMESKEEFDEDTIARVERYTIMATSVDELNEVSETLLNQGFDEKLVQEHVAIAIKRLSKEAEKCR